MMARGFNRVTVRRPAANVSDGAGGWASPGDTTTSERVTVRTPSYQEREIAGRLQVAVSNVLDFRTAADVKIGDRIDVPGMPRLQVVAIPAEGMPRRKTKAVYCMVEGDTHGGN